MYAALRPPLSAALLARCFDGRMLDGCETALACRQEVAKRYDVNPHERRAANRRAEIDFVAPLKTKSAHA